MTEVFRLDSGWLPPQAAVGGEAGAEAASLVRLAGCVLRGRGDPAAPGRPYRTDPGHHGGEFYAMAAGGQIIFT